MGSGGNPQVVTRGGNPQQVTGWVTRELPPSKPRRDKGKADFRGVVTYPGGNLIFAADGSEMPGSRPPHGILRRKDPFKYNELLTLPGMLKEHERCKLYAYRLALAVKRLRVTSAALARS